MDCVCGVCVRVNLHIYMQVQTQLLLTIGQYPTDGVKVWSVYLFMCGMYVHGVCVKCVGVVYTLQVGADPTITNNPTVE